MSKSIFWTGREIAIKGFGEVGMWLNGEAQCNTGMSGKYCDCGLIQKRSVMT